MTAGVVFLPTEIALRIQGLAQMARWLYDGGMDSYQSVIATSTQPPSGAAAIAFALLPASLLGLLLLRQART